MRIQPLAHGKDCASFADGSAVGRLEVVVGVVVVAVVAVVAVGAMTVGAGAVTVVTAVRA